MTSTEYDSQQSHSKATTKRNGKNNKIGSAFFGQMAKGGGKQVKTTGPQEGNEKGAQGAARGIRFSNKSD